MTFQPTISVLISTYNETVLDVEKTINNILEQSYSPKEIILILDDPKNLTVRDFLSKTAKENPKLKIIFNEKNLGLGASLNKAISLATGDYLARMDIGDFSNLNRFQKQISYFQKNPTTDLLFTGWREIFEDNSQRENIPNPDDFKKIKKSFFTKSLLLHASLMTKKEVLKQNSYPPTSRPEDFILFLNLIHKNYNFAAVPEVLYTYHIDRRLRYKKIRQYANNYLPHLTKNIRYYWKNPWFWLYYLRIIGEYIVSRNEKIFNLTHGLAGKIWKKINS